MNVQLSQSISRFLDRYRSWDPHAWLTTVLVAFFAAWTRLPGLGRISHLVFDETYYVKDAYSLWTLGYEGKWRLPEGSPIDSGDEGAVRDAINTAFVAGDFSGLTLDPSYTVHPPTGKWLIGLGMQIFGPHDPTGWRFMTALAGILCVVLIARICWHLFHQRMYVLAASAFLAVDGISIVLSRTALLDGFLTCFTLAAFLCVVIDYRRSRPILEHKLSECSSSRTRKRALGPHAGSRGWLVLAGMFSGLALSTKWSGLYVLAVLGLLVVGYEIATRIGKLPHPLSSAVIVEGIPAFLLLVPTAVLVYIASWWSWFAHSDAWGRVHPGIVGALNDFVSYHGQVYQFHTDLSAEHSYMSSAPDWLIQRRPTSFAFDTVDKCAGSDCVAAVLALGNPILWWGGTLALIWLFGSLIQKLIRRQDAFSESIISAGFAATYLPWFAYLSRTTFNFYTVIIAPFIALTCAWAIRELNKRAVEAGGRARAVIYGGIGVFVLATLLAFIFFYPVWSGLPIPRDNWRQRMWFQSWV